MSTHDLALAVRDRDRDDLVGESRPRLRRDGPLVGARGELVLLLAGMAYSRRRFSAVSSMPPGTGWFLPPAVDPAAGEAVVQLMPSP